MSLRIYLGSLFAFMISSVSLYSVLNPSSTALTSPNTKCRAQGTHPDLEMSNRTYIIDTEIPIRVLTMFPLCSPIKMQNAPRALTTHPLVPVDLCAFQTQSSSSGREPDPVAPIAPVRAREFGWHPYSLYSTSASPLFSTRPTISPE